MKYLKEGLLLSFGAAAGLAIGTVAEKDQPNDILFTDFVCEDEMGGELFHGRSYGGHPQGIEKSYGEISYYQADGAKVTQNDCPNYRATNTVLKTPSQ